LTVYIDPVKELGGKLLNVEKPGRYTGGEAGRIAKVEKNYRTLIAFPDLYEIGMGNQAVRILYNCINNLEDVSCDRSFAPAPDFEKMLRENKIPLYGLDTGIALFCVDLLMFTLGYELGLNGILTMLDVSKIPLHCDERDENHPLIIAGGPAVSNPAPYSPFIDAFWMGEAESGFFDLVSELALLKKEGQSRAAQREKIACHPNIWVKGKSGAKRAITSGFAFNNMPAAVYPIPSMKIIQHHGSMEIMRGCPNGCRFCHAGFWYRPARQKNMEQIISHVNDFIELGGWQEISLSSLSSGDYNGIGELIDSLNKKFSEKKVSFQLPSLKVSGFSLPILEKISITRKSGLTFAVETPLDYWQLAINKEVTYDSVVSILTKAKESGWRGAKFYFMIGLPPACSNQMQMKNEEEEIVNFITDVGRRTRMHFNINIGIFIPKPHTPYQCASQMDSETAERKMIFIRSKLKPLGHKVSTSDTLILKIEGLLSRGDYRAGLLCEEAWKSGSRLDPWNEFIDRQAWHCVLEKNSSYAESVFSGKNDPLPWADIDSGVSKNYLQIEYEKSINCIRTPSCKVKCSSCGVCKKETGLDEQDKEDINVNHADTCVNDKMSVKNDPVIYRMIFSFSKEGSAVFHGHLSIIEIFSMSLRRACIPVIYTQGFNPLVKMEFSSPLTTGISADCEIASVDLKEEFNGLKFINDLNKSLPGGIKINNANCFYIDTGIKKHSLTSLLWGFSYVKESGIDFVKAKDEKVYRNSRLKEDESLFSLRRREVLARNIIDDKNEYASYFDVFGFLYKKL